MTLNKNINVTTRLRRQAKKVQNNTEKTNNKYTSQLCENKTFGMHT